MYSSSKIAVFIFKATNLTVCVGLLLMWMQLFFGSNQTMLVNSEEESITFLNTSPLLFALLFFGYLFYWAVRKLKSVEMSETDIYILSNSDKLQYQWKDVESIRKLLFIANPTYKLKFKNEEGSHYFITSLFGFQIFFISFDTSKIGSLIERKKAELGLN